MPERNLSFSFFFSKKEIKKQLMITGVLIFFLLGANLFFYFKIKHTSQELLSLRREIVNTQQLLSRFSVLKIQQREAKPFLLLLEKLVPNKQGILKSVTKIQEIAQQNSLQQSFSFGQEYRPETGGVGNIGFSLILNGSLSSLADYLRTLENLPLFIQFNYIEIMKRDNDYQFNSSGRIYMREK